MKKKYDVTHQQQYDFENTKKLFNTASAALNQLQKIIDDLENNYASISIIMDSDQYRVKKQEYIDKFHENEEIIEDIIKKLDQKHALHKERDKKMLITLKTEFQKNQIIFLEKIKLITQENKNYLYESSIKITQFITDQKKYNPLFDPTIISSDSVESLKSLKCQSPLLMRYSVYDQDKEIKKLLEERQGEINLTEKAVIQLKELMNYANEEIQEQDGKINQIVENVEKIHENVKIGVKNLNITVGKNVDNDSKNNKNENYNNNNHHHHHHNHKNNQNEETKTQMQYLEIQTQHQQLKTSNESALQNDQTFLTNNKISVKDESFENKKLRKRDRIRNWLKGFLNLGCKNQFF